MKESFKLTVYLFIVLTFFSEKVIAQKFDWYGFYDVEANQKAIIEDIELDHEGNVYTCGTFTKADFDIGPGTAIREANYGRDYFISKYDSLGHWIWTVTRGQNYILDDHINALEIDENNNIYAVGYDDNDFHNDRRFILKLNSSGQILWRKDFFRTYPQLQYAQLSFMDLELDHHGDLVIVGSLFDTTDMDPGPGVQLFYPSGHYDLLVMKVNPNGDVIWVKNMGSNGTYNSICYGNYLAIDTSNQIWVSGYYTGRIDFDPGPGELYRESPGLKNPFLAKYNEDGDLQWAKQVTTSNASYENTGGPLFIKATGEVYWTYPYKIDIYDPDVLSDTFQLHNSHPTMLLKLNPDGSIDHTFTVATNQGVRALHVYPNGDILVFGNVYDTEDIDHTFEGVVIKSNGWEEKDLCLMIKYDRNGKYLWSRELTDKQSGIGYVAADDHDNIYLAYFFTTEIDLTGEEDNPVPKHTIPYGQYFASTFSSYIMKYKKLDCTGLEVEYITTDNSEDIGLEPNVSNVPFWKSPSLRVPLYPGTYSNHSLDFDETFYDNYVQVKVQSKGCSTISNSKIALYYSIGDEGLLSPGPWQTKYSDFGGNTLPISGKVGEMDIPPLYKNETWEGAFHFTVPVDPKLFPDKTYSINMFGRIESAFDHDADIPFQSILEQVANNNNISWRVFQVNP